MPDLAGLGQDWVLVSGARLGADAIDMVLLHPRCGVALLQVAPRWTLDAPARLRQRLDQARFGAIFNGHLPVVHRMVSPQVLPELPRLLAEAFAGQPPLDLPGGDAWMRVVHRALLADPTAPAAAPARAGRRRRLPVAAGLGLAGLLAGLALLTRTGGPEPRGVLPVGITAADAAGVSEAVALPGPAMPAGMVTAAAASEAAAAPEPAAPPSAAEAPPEATPLADEAAPVPPPPFVAPPVTVAAPGLAEPPPVALAALPSPLPLALALPTAPHVAGVPDVADAAAPPPPFVPPPVPPVAALPRPQAVALAPEAPVQRTPEAPVQPMPVAPVQAMSEVPRLQAPAPVALVPAAALPGLPAAPALVAPPPAPARRAAADPAALSALLRRGEALLAIGDVSGARRFFERVAEAGHAAGARAMGRTYDPEVLASLQAWSMLPDPATAATWYRRAREMEAMAMMETPR
ncbi:hypothetical protein ACFQY5_01015 [Paeniroseomonas aquatica]|uniref:hypothetical protein n=1 Tax=Paeniroseomonas aquatica TaxID=373043 RepID=UPI00361E1A42